MNEEFLLLSLSYPNTTSYGFLNYPFDNLGPDDTIKVGDYTFTARYSASAIKLEVTHIDSGGGGTAPPGTIAFTNTSGGSYNHGGNWSSGTVTTNSFSISGGTFNETLGPYATRVYEFPSGITWNDGETLKLTLTKYGDQIPAEPGFSPSLTSNLIANGSFEDDWGRLPGWPYGWNAGMSITEPGVAGVLGGRWVPVSDSTAPHGNRSMFHDKPTAGVANSDETQNVLGIAPAINQRLYFGIDHSTTTTCTVSFDVKVNNPGGTKMSVIIDQDNLSSPQDPRRLYQQFRSYSPDQAGWERFAFTFTMLDDPDPVVDGVPQEKPDTGSLTIELLGDGPAPSHLYIDRVQIEQGNTTGNDGLPFNEVAN